MISLPSSRCFDGPRISSINWSQIIQYSPLHFQKPTNLIYDQKSHSSSNHLRYPLTHIKTPPNHNNANLPHIHRPPPRLPPSRSRSGPHNLHPLPLRLRLRLCSPMASPRRLPTRANLRSTSAQQRSSCLPPPLRRPRSRKLV